MYFGTWKDDRPINVTLTYKDKTTTYEGVLNSDLKPNGEGTMTKNGTTTIEGSWINGEPDLTEEFIILDKGAGTEYIGEVNSEFKPDGKGLFYNYNGTTTIEGFWTNGEPDLTKDFTIKDEKKKTEYTGKVNSEFKPNSKGMILDEGVGKFIDNNTLPPPPPLSRTLPPLPP